jgi:hypothetical protein
MTEIKGLSRLELATLIIVNQQATDMDSIADLVIHAGIGDTMKAVLQVRG